MTFTVVNTADNGGIDPAPFAGTGTLRQAIVDSNANPGADSIEFGIPGVPGTVHTIAPLSQLPTIWDTVTIDGTTQFGFDSSGPRLIELSGTNIPAPLDVNDDSHPVGLELVAHGNSIVRGLAINDFATGISIHATHHLVVEGNYLGLDPTGAHAPPTQRFNVSGTPVSMVTALSLSDSFECVIGGTTAEARNVISASYDGILILNAAHNNRMIGNYLGTDKTSTQPLPNSHYAVLGQNSVYNQIGEPGAGNVVLGIVGIVAGTGNVIQANSVAVCIDSNPIGGFGVQIRHSYSSNNLIGGNSPATRNVVNFVQIEAGSHDNKIQGNYIGLSAAGTARIGGDVQISDGSHHNTVGTDGDGILDAAEGNVIAGNDSGVNIWGLGSDYNVIAGNLIGTNALGTAGIVASAAGDGVGVDTNNNRIGTNGDGISDDLERNILSGGFLRGVRVSGQFNTVAGNYIGTNKAGTAALPNRNGAIIGGANNRLGTNADGVNDSAERNVISGNIDLGAGVGGGNSVAGNYIGTDVTGLTAIANGVGVSIGGSTLGGTTATARNVIAGNLRTGVEGYNNAVIQGNYIGVNKNGSPLGNGADGVFVHFVQENITVGGVAPGAANIIAYNGRSGVTVSHTLQHAVPMDPSTRIAIRGNSIHSNTSLGIDLAEIRWTGNGVPDQYVWNELVFGVTQNDPQDSDNGNNRLQNFPLLATTYSGAHARVLGSLNSTPGSAFTVDFYANSAADPSGHGEGQRYLGSTTVTTDGAGNASFDAVGLAAAAAGEFITATATDAVGNTSEFSVAAIAVNPVQIVGVNILPESINLDSNGTLTVVIYGAANFNAAQIDVSTVRFAGAASWQSALVDANNDGRQDMQLKFRRQDTALLQLYEQLLTEDHDGDGVLDTTRQVAEVAVTGETLDDHLFSGTDSVTLFLAGRSLRELLNRLFG